MSDIFISHASRDDAYAEEVKTILRDNGYTDAFLDFDAELGVIGGTKWKRALYKKLRECKVVILILTESWVKSDYCQWEYNNADFDGKVIVPIRFEDYGGERVADEYQHVDFLRYPEEKAKRLVAALQAAGVNPGNIFEPDLKRSPYPGLSSFEEEDAAIFFGRDWEIQKTLETLEAARRRNDQSLFYLWGASGSGKSSLMRAGLLPRLRRNRRNWMPLRAFRPGIDPMRSFAHAMQQAFAEVGKDWQEEGLYELFRDAIATGECESLLEKCAIRLRQLDSDDTDENGDPLVSEETCIVVPLDQSEELFSYESEETSREFFKLIKAIANAPGWFLLATIRSDFLTQLQSIEELEALNEQRELIEVPIMRDAYAARLIERPAEIYKIEVERELVAEMIDDASASNTLPLFAYTLRELWERYGKKTKKLTLANYNELGRIEGAIRRSAEEILGKYPSKSPEDLAELIEEVRRAFVPAMVRVTDDLKFARQRARLDDMPPRARPVLEKLVEARLLTTFTINGVAYVEVTHESLFYVWPMLAGWLDEDLVYLKIIRDVKRAAFDWDDKGRDRKDLIHIDERKKEADEIQKLARFSSRLTKLELEYLSACQDEQDQRDSRSRRNKWAIIVLGAIALMLLFSFFVYNISTKISVLKLQSEVFGGQAQTRNKNGQFATAIKMSLTGLPPVNKSEILSPVSDLAKTELRYSLLNNTLIKSLRHDLAPNGSFPTITHAEFSSNGDFVATASTDSTAKVWKSDAGTFVLVKTIQHDAIVDFVTFSPISSKLVTASRDNTAIIYDPVSDTEIALVGHRDFVNYAEFSPAGDEVVTASDDGTLRRWSVATGRQIWASASTHTGQVYRARYSPTGKKIVSASFDGTAIVWDLETNQPLRRFAHGDFVTDAKFSPDGSLLATSSNDGTAKIWDLDSENTITLEGHDGVVTQVSFSNSGSKIATTSLDLSAAIWDLSAHLPEIGDSSRKLRLGQDSRRIFHRAAVQEAHFSSDDKYLLTASQDNTALISDLETTRPVQTFSHNGPVFSARFSPETDKVLTASADGSARVWEFGLQKFVSATLPSGFPIEKIAYSRDDKHAAFVEKNGFRVSVWEIDNKRLVRPISHPTASPISIDFSPTEDKLVVGYSNGEIFEYSIASGSEPVSIGVHEEAIRRNDVTTLSYSSNGNLILSGSFDKTVRVWNSDSEEIGFLPINGLVTAAEFSPDDKIVAISSTDGQIALWDYTSDQIVSFFSESDRVNSVSFSPDGTLVGAATSNGIVFTIAADSIFNDYSDGDLVDLIQAVDGKKIKSFSGIYAAQYLDFSSDNSKVIVTYRDQAAYLIDLQKNIAIARLQHPSVMAGKARFLKTSGGEYVVSSDSDGKVYVWSSTTGRRFFTWTEHDDEIRDFIVSNDNTTIVSVSLDQRAIVYDVPPTLIQLTNEMTQSACDLLIRVNEREFFAEESNELGEFQKVISKDPCNRPGIKSLSWWRSAPETFINWASEVTAQLQK